MASVGGRAPHYGVCVPVSTTHVCIFNPDFKEHHNATSNTCNLRINLNMQSTQLPSNSKTLTRVLSVSQPKIEMFFEPKINPKRRKQPKP